MSKGPYKYIYQDKTGTTHQHVALVHRSSTRSFPECSVIKVKLGAGFNGTRSSDRL